MELLGLGYIGVTAADPQAWLRFACDVVGFMPARAIPGESYGMPAIPGSGPASAGSGIAPDGSVYLKMDERQWRVAVHPGDGPGVAYLGFEVAHAAALAAAAAELQARDLSYSVGTEDECRSRGVQGLLVLEGPAASRVELFYGGVTDFKFVSPTGSTFLTGGLGLGHCLLFVPDMDDALRFFREVLGFRRSDFIGFGPGMSAQFLRCTPRHHSVGLVHVAPMFGIHHLMFEMTTIDDVGRAYDRAKDAKLPITASIGRHVNDGMFSFYVQSPAGFDVEVGCDGTLVDEATWNEREFVEGDTWGHRGLTVDAIEQSAAG